MHHDWNIMEGPYVENSVLKVEISFSSRRYTRIFFTKLRTKCILPNIITFILVHKHFFWEVTKEVNYLFWIAVILRHSSIIWNNFSVPTDLCNRITPAFKMNADWKSVLWQHLSLLLIPILSPSLWIYIIITTYPGLILSESSRHQTVKKKTILYCFSSIDQ